MTPQQQQESRELAEYMGWGPYEDGRYGTMWPDPACVISENEVYGL